MFAGAAVAAEGVDCDGDVAAAAEVVPADDVVLGADCADNRIVVSGHAADADVAAAGAADRAAVQVREHQQDGMLVARVHC